MGTLSLNRPTSSLPVATGNRGSNDQVGTSPGDVAPMARGYEIGQEIILLVAIQVIYNQFQRVRGILGACAPSDDLPAPMARVTPWANGIVEGDSMSPDSATCGRERMFRAIETAPISINTRRRFGASKVIPTLSGAISRRLTPIAGRLAKEFRLTPITFIASHGAHYTTQGVV